MSRGQQFFSLNFVTAVANNSEFDFEYARGNVDFTVAVSALRNGASFVFIDPVTVASFINPNNRRLYMFTNITANPSAITLTPQINMVDPVTSNTNVIEIAAAGSTTTFVSLFEFVPRKFNIEMVHSGAGDVTYSIGACIIIG